MKEMIKISGKANQTKNKMRRMRSDHLNEGEDGKRRSPSPRDR